MLNDRPAITFPVALILALGLAGLGWLAGQGIVQARLADRFVTVKGVSELDVEADLAFWSISISVPSSEVGRAQDQIDESIDRVIAFLGQFGIERANISRQGSQVVDRATQVNRPQSDLRYVVTNTLMVRTTDVAAVETASEAVGQLLAEGVPLSNGQSWGSTRPTYAFTGLNGVKPDMLAEATAAARNAAQQFANDSGGEVGAIRRANQGVFVIQGRDRAPGTSEASQRLKTVRVVTTVEYQLVG